MSEKAENPRVESVHPVVRDGALFFLIDETIYSREAVLRACYWFTDRSYLFISRPSSGHLTVTVRAKPGGPALEVVAGDFGNALLDQQVRIDIERETRALRELIVAKAFAASGALEDPPVGDDRDPVELERSGAPGGQGLSGAGNESGK